MSFNVKELVKTAWDKTQGEKGTLWSAVVAAELLVLAPFLVLTIIALLLPHSAFIAMQQHLGASISVGIILVIALVIYSFYMMLLISSISYMALQYLRGQAIHYAMIFKSWEHKGAIFFNMFLFALFNACIFSGHIHKGFLHMLAPLIFGGLATLYLRGLLNIINELAFLQVYDKGQTGATAFVTSWKLFFKYWREYLILGLWTLLLSLFNMVTLGIAAIWTMPAVNNIYALLHEELSHGEG